MKNVLQTTPGNIEDVTRKDVLIRHNLGQSGMFDDENLAKIIDVARKAGPQFYTLGALDNAGFGDKWQSGIIENLDGKEVLQAIKKGRLWLQVQRLKELLPSYHQLAIRAFDELQSHNKDFGVHKLTSNILISSPGARVLCHLDCAEVILWHLRGKKQVFLYDHETHDLLPPEAIEQVLLRETEEEIPYKQDWDKVAKSYELSPGMAVSWPHFWPHRVDNVEGLNVSMQTEYYSDKGLKNYGVRFANGVMRRRTGKTGFSTNTQGVMALAKCGVGLVAKKLGLHKSKERIIPSQFIIDPKSAGSIRQLDKPLQSILEK